MTTGWLQRHRKVMAWTAGTLALVLVGLAMTGYAVLRHFNDNIQQVNVTAMLGSQPPNLHPKAENILLMASGPEVGQGSSQVDGPLNTLMIMHVSASKKWADVMSIPFNSWVKIPSCKMGNGRMSAPTQSPISEAFAIGNRYGDHTTLGIACMVKTVEQDTGIYIGHFIDVKITGFKDMVAALGGVKVCLPTAFTDPSAGVVLSAGCHVLTPAQAFAYVRALNGTGVGSVINRIARQRTFISALISQAKGELSNPLAIYRFFDAFTKSLTIDSQLGGVTGLYHLGQSVHGIPSKEVASFTLPNYPRANVVPSDTLNALWKQPQDNEIFASIRNDTPIKASLLTAGA